MQVEGALGRPGLEVRRDIVDAQDLLGRGSRGSRGAAGSGEGRLQIVDLVQKGLDDLVSDLHRHEHASSRHKGGEHEHALSWQPTSGVSMMLSIEWKLAANDTLRTCTRVLVKIYVTS